MNRTHTEIGLAVVGCGTIGRIRAEIARDYPGVGWLGLCDIKADLGQRLQVDTGADFFTESFAELLARPEVTAAIIATDENHHAAPPSPRSSAVSTCSLRSRSPRTLASPGRSCSQSRPPASMS